jgi:hypothetical protein
MDFKTFLIKRVMMSFFISVTLITLAMAIVGLIFEPHMTFGYEAFLSPLIFGSIASFPMLVFYSKKEQSIKEALLRSLLHFMLLEILLLSSLYFLGILTSFSIASSLALTILIINLAVHLVTYVHDNRAASEFNTALKKLQESIQEES